MVNSFATNSALTMPKRCVSADMAGRNGKPTSATFSSDPAFQSGSSDPASSRAATRGHARGFVFDGLQTFACQVIAGCTLSILELRKSNPEVAQAAPLLAPAQFEGGDQPLASACGGGT